MDKRSSEEIIEELENCFINHDEYILRLLAELKESRDAEIKKLREALLEQRAKIGWNKQSNSGERILEVVGNTSERYLKYGKYQEIIDLSQIDDETAIEQALKYIYKQERK